MALPAGKLGTVYEERTAVLDPERAKAVDDDQTVRYLFEAHSQGQRVIANGPAEIGTGG